MIIEGGVLGFRASNGQRPDAGNLIPPTLISSSSIRVGALGEIAAFDDLAGHCQLTIGAGGGCRSTTSSPLRLARLMHILAVQALGNG